MPILKISEIFYSLQGEGKRAGEPSIFIRLSGCSAKHACYARGVRCDTEFESGRSWSLAELRDYLKALTTCKWIVWTGGEPADQLTEEAIEYFDDLGYLQAIETSGVKPVPNGIKWITLSPKVAEHVLEKNFPHGVTEIKYVRHIGQDIPEPKISAKYKFISPHFDGINPNEENIRHCIDLCLKNPEWSLSIQQHKLWQIL